MSQPMSEETAPVINELTAATLRGRFIVLDGPEGCGKSTQAKLLGKKLETLGLSAVLVRDPGTTRVGERVRAILLDPLHGEMGMRCEMLLYMAARAQMMTETILPALNAGKVVVCDRFVSSTLAYQLGGDGLTSKQIRSIGDVAIKGRWPDLTVILDVCVARGIERARGPASRPGQNPAQEVFTWFRQERREEDRIEMRPLSYHEQVRRNYLAQANADPRHYRVINADRPPEQVHADIWTALLTLS